MTPKEKWDFINDLDNQLLKGGVIMSEFSTFLSRDAEIAFCSGSNLGAILTAAAAIETHLRWDTILPESTKSMGLFDLINYWALPTDIHSRLHELRLFRNRWVHVGDPWDDSSLIQQPEYHESELEEMAKSAIRLMLEVLYLNQFV